MIGRAPSSANHLSISHTSFLRFAGSASADCWSINGHWNGWQPRGTALERENAMLRERLAEVTEFKDNVIEDLRRRLDAEAEERRKLTMILTDRRLRIGWWRRLFSRRDA
jgi:hypothetical protein